MAEVNEAEQKALQKMIKRRHPEYTGRLPHWQFLRATYEGGRAWFDSNVFRYIKEGDKEYTDRVSRAYRFNHTREVVDLLDKYIFKMAIVRKEDAPKMIQDFWARSTRGGIKIDDFMKKVSTETSKVGRVWVVVDREAKDEQGAAISLAEQRRLGTSTYAYIVSPENVLDMSYDDDEKLRWILIHEQGRNDADPLESDGAEIDRYRLWERDRIRLYEVRKVENAVKVVLVDDRKNELGEIPVFPADNVISTELYTSPALIDDVAYLDRAIANYLSNLDAIIQDQTFSQLAMPSQGLLSGETTANKLLEMGTKRIFLYDGESGAKPEFISPDVHQAEIILKVINKIINEIYHSVGLAGERTKEDNAQGIDNSSGVAKAYDFERVNSLLCSKAASLERVEERLCHFVLMYAGENGEAEDLIHYPDSFDVRGLYDEFEIAARLALVEAPDTVRREQMSMLVDKLFPKLIAGVKAEIEKELKSWPPEIIDPMTGETKTQTLVKSGNNSLANALVK